MLTIERARQLIEAGKFDDLDDLLPELITDKDIELDQLLDIVNELRNRQQTDRAGLMLELLAEHFEAQRAYRRAIEVHKVMLQLHEESPPIRRKIIELYRRQHAGALHLEEYLECSGLTTGGPVMRALERFEAYLTYDIGKCFYFERYGTGEVVAVAPEKREIVVDFEKKPKHFLPIDVARSILVPVDEHHFLHAKRHDLARLRSMAAAQPVETVIALLQSFNEPLTASQIKAHLTGVVEAGELNRFWEKVRKALEKHERVRFEGRTTKVYAYVRSADDKHRHAIEAFHAAVPDEQYRLAQDYATRLPAAFASLVPHLTELGRQARQDRPGLALDILMLLEDTGHAAGIDYTAEELLRTHGPERLLEGMIAPPHRDRLLGAVKARDPDHWPAFATSLAFNTGDGRLLGALIDHLADTPAVQQEILDRISAMPARHPKQFQWLLRRIESGAFEAYLTPSMIPRLISSLERVPGVRSTARKLLALERFDMVAARAKGAEAQRIRDALKSSTVLSEHEKNSYLRILEHHFPELAEPKTGVIYSTRAALLKKKAELERLLTVEIPANKKEIGRAREYGDLSENFEYKAAKERQDQLYARVKTIEAELAQTQVIDPAAVTTDAVSVGTTVRLARTADGSTVEYTILGRWDTDLDRNVISNEAPLAQAVLGRKRGDRVSLDGLEYEIIEIRPGS